MKIFFTKLNFTKKIKEVQRNFLFNTQKYTFSSCFTNKSNRNTLYNILNKNLITSNINSSLIQTKQNNHKGFNLFKLSVMYMRSAKTRLKLKYPKKYKMKTKKGLAKRITIVGGLFDRGFKFKSPGARHKMINKTRANRA